MVWKLGYDSHVMRLNSATVAVLTLVLGGLLFPTPAANGQINGTPASVTSINSGGHFNSTPGVPASITSLGPKGLQPRNPGFNNPAFNQPGCCTLFQVNPNPSRGQRNHHHRSGQFFPGNGAVYVPYAYQVIPKPTMRRTNNKFSGKKTTVEAPPSSTAAVRASWHPLTQTHMPRGRAAPRLRPRLLQHPRRPRLLCPTSLRPC